jgi:hypothetical protein
LADSGARAPYIQAVAAGPADGASPEQIVEGFLQATLAGSSDDFAVARSYLTHEAASAWDPSSGVALYRSGEAPILTAVEGDSGSITVGFTQVGAVDLAGNYTVVEATQRNDDFLLAQDDDDQWRIRSLPDGIVIPMDVFTADFSQVTVYFATTDHQYLVPDIRWFPRRSAATALVKQFLAGPPPYLAGAVDPVVPTGTRLATDAVQVTDRVATVNLSETMAGADEEVRAVTLACLEASLTSLADVASVELQVASVPVQVNALVDPPELAPVAGAVVYFLTDSGLSAYSGAEALPVRGFEGAAVWETLAVSTGAERAAGRVNGQLAVIGGPYADMEPASLVLPEPEPEPEAGEGEGEAGEGEAGAGEGEGGEGGAGEGEPGEGEPAEGETDPAPVDEGEAADEGEAGEAGETEVEPGEEGEGEGGLGEGESGEGESGEGEGEGEAGEDGEAEGDADEEAAEPVPNPVTTANTGRWAMPGDLPVTAGPVFDQVGELWVGGGSNVVVFSTYGRPTALEASWLAGHTVVSVVPARDGARVAIAYTTPDEATVQLVVAGLDKSAGGRVWTLNTPKAVAVLADVPLSVAWAGEAALAVLAPSEAGGTPVPSLVAIGGETSVLNLPGDTPTSLAGGHSLYELYLTGANGGLYQFTRQGRIWSGVTQGAKAAIQSP